MEALSLDVPRREASLDSPPEIFAEKLATVHSPLIVVASFLFDDDEDDVDDTTPRNLDSTKPKLEITRREVVVNLDMIDTCIL